MVGVYMERLSTPTLGFGALPNVGRVLPPVNPPYRYQSLSTMIG